ncbi:MAG: TetR/AcrR family transcriptional regulator [Nitriliruptorales bacterium]|nr:TetR/AcrR family transcriptional regulator [Nitriliruptorales bacterium]
MCAEAADTREDPRVTRSKATVITTVLDLIGERGVAHTTVDEVSERSGVAKTTIYRHWASRAELVLDAIATLLEPPPVPDTGALHSDLYELVDGLIRALTSSPLAGLMPSLMEAAERDPEFAELHRRQTQQRHRAVREVIDRGVRRGELPQDVDRDLALALLAGPVFYRRFVSTETVDHDFGRAVVDAALRALTAR